ASPVPSSGHRRIGPAGVADPAGRAVPWAGSPRSIHFRRQVMKKVFSGTRKDRGVALVAAVGGAALAACNSGGGTYYRPAPSYTTTPPPQGYYVQPQPGYAQPQPGYAPTYPTAPPPA